MGAVCGRPNKPKSNRSKQYQDNNNNNDNSSKFKDIKEIPSDRSLNPAQALNNEIPSPSRPLGPNINQENRDIQDNAERRVTEEHLKDSFLVHLQGKETDRVPGETQFKFPVRVQGPLPIVDQSQKGQAKPLSSEPVNRPKTLVVPGSGLGSVNMNQASYGNFDIQGNMENVFEPIYQEKNVVNDDYYLEMSEVLLKKYEQFQNNSKLNIKSKSLGGGPNQNRIQTQLLEWANLFKKHFSQEKSPVNVYENKNKLNKAYKLLLGLDERNWYEEMVTLYKEKQSMSKNTGNMTGLTFDRKMIQLQEQFRWLVSAVANTRLNPNNVVGVHEFPPYKVFNRKKGDKLDSSGISLGRGQYSVTGSDENSEILSPVRSQHSQMPHISSARTQIGGFSYLENPPDPRENYYSDFPDIFSPAWQEGFLWKGVYLKLYSKLEAQQLKKELKVLKHMGVEYLQTETSMKINDLAQSISIAHNESMEGFKSGGNQTLNALLPLICTVESSSWVLLGTPMFPVKKGSTEDNISKVGIESSGFLKNTFLLSNLTSKNFKAYYKAEEIQSAPIVHTFGNLAQSAYAQNVPSQTNSNFLLLANVGKTSISLPKVNVMMIVSQEINSNVSFLEYPRRGLEPEMIKKMLGYSDEDIGLEALFVNKKNKNENWDRDSKLGHDLYFEILKFKRGGWLMQMIYVASRRSLPPTFVTNKRATDLLSNSDIKKMTEIKGNVLLFGYLPNTNSLVHPYFISEQTLTASFIEEAPKGLMPNVAGPLKPGNPSQLLEAGSFVGRDNKESIIRGSFNFNKTLKDEKVVQDYFIFNIGRSIDNIVDQLENSDAILNFASLKELFHKKGVNMRFEWIVYARLKREKAKVLVGSDILARCLKRMLAEKTSKRLKYFRKPVGVGLMDPAAQKKKMDEIIQDKTDFFLEDFYKKALCLYINTLIRDNGENPESQANDLVFQDLSTDLFLQRMRALDLARKCLSTNSFDFYLSGEITKTIVNIPCLHANMFLDAISHHFHISLNYDIVRQVRNDKYIHWVSGQGLLVKPTDFSILYTNDYYLTTYERCYLLLLKFLATSQLPSDDKFIELSVPSALYKLRRPRAENELQVSSYDCFLHDYYEIPNLEILNDWVVLLESALNGLYTPDGQQNLLIEGYILQMVLAFFAEEENDNQLSRSILEKINTFANTSAVTSPELTVVIHTWYGILAESKLFVECEQNYSIALLILHKLYGDPRGRGGNGTPWELFITSRLSILSRLQGKIHDAEYSEELFDATLMTLRDNPANEFAKSHYIYKDPLRAFQSNNCQQVEQSYLQQKLSLKNVQINDHPFMHWVNHLAFDETSAKIDTLNETLEKTSALLKWMITYMPIFQPTGIRWDTAYLRDFFLSIMQSTVSNTTSVSSVSNVSVDKGRGDRSGFGLDLSANPRLSGIRSDKKDKKYNPGGSLVQVFEKDASTLAKREINGTVYSWGQNDKGQVGSTMGSIEEVGMIGKKKMKIYYPKRIITLKDTIIQSVACGHSHSIAITLDGQLLAWGDNKHSQLGLGSKAPTEVYVPALVPNIKDVAHVACGNEHTVALTKAGHVYSWGEGEEGLLGHGDTRSQNVPKRMEAFRNMEIQAIACGGLHSLALTKQGTVYAWGKGEGGQLGVPNEQMIKNPDKHVYLTVPTRVRSTLEGQFVTQIACGDAHSLALTQKGIVYSWGYAYQGQLGIGLSSETLADPNQPCQVSEPTPIDRLSTIKITDIFAGATFSMFLSDKKELYGCGLNDSNQLGIEKNITKVGGGQLERIGVTSPKASESAYPKKLDCFTSMPVLSVACGEAHSVALVFCESSYMLFSWGLQRQGQLGIGETQLPNYTPRPISFLQYVMAYSMGCGSYHSLVVLGEPSKAFRKEALIERLEKKSENRWMSAFFEVKGSYESMIEMALNNLDNIIPSEEGKIVNPKAIRKTPTQS